MCVSKKEVHKFASECVKKRESRVYLPQACFMLQNYPLSVNFQIPCSSSIYWWKNCICTEGRGNADPSSIKMKYSTVLFTWHIWLGEEIGLVYHANTFTQIKRSSEITLRGHFCNVSQSAMSGSKTQPFPIHVIWRTSERVFLEHFGSVVIVVVILLWWG